MYSTYMRKERRGDARREVRLECRNGTPTAPDEPRPFGLRPKYRHAALPDSRLQSASFASGALPGDILISQRIDRRSVHRP